MTTVQYPMTNCASIVSPFRRVCAAVLAALVIGQSSLVIAAAPSATVVAVQTTRVADVVLLGGGFDAGLRQGMVCRVMRGTTEIAEVLLVDLRPACSAALILSVASRQSIRPGDLAGAKILKT
jgi:hypothetical protein